MTEHRISCRNHKDRKALYYSNNNGYTCEQCKTIDSCKINQLKPYANINHFKKFILAFGKGIGSLFIKLGKHKQENPQLYEKQQMQLQYSREIGQLLFIIPPYLNRIICKEHICKNSYECNRCGQAYCKHCNKNAKTLKYIYSCSLCKRTYCIIHLKKHYAYSKHDSCIQSELDISKIDEDQAKAIIKRKECKQLKIIGLRNVSDKQACIRQILMAANESKFITELSN